MTRWVIACTLMLLGGRPAVAPSFNASVVTLPISHGGAQDTRNCLTLTPVSCPSDLRAVPITGLALQGYLDTSSGLFIKIIRAFVGRVTQDEGCSGTTPQYQLYLRVMFHNTRRRPVVFDLVGLTVQDQTATIYDPFAWGGGPPGHAQPQVGNKARTIWLPYYLGPKPTALSVWWAYISPGRSAASRRVALYRVHPTGVKTCQP